jgi:F0F1-type ATP synthase epsilon subunit
MKSQAKAQKTPQQQKSTRKVTKTTKRNIATKKVVKKAPVAAKAPAFPVLSLTSPTMRAMTTAAVQAPVVAKKSAKKTFSVIQRTPAFQAQNTQLFRQTNKQFAEEAKKIKDYFEISIASPNIAPYKNAQAYSVYISAAHGERGILRNSAANIYTLRPGALRVFEEQGQQPKTWFVPAGVARVANDDKALTVTCTEMIPLDDLCPDQAKKMLDASTAAAASAMDAAEKNKHTVNMRVAQSVIKAIERFGVAKQ